MTKLKDLVMETKVPIVLLMTNVEEKLTKKSAPYCLLTLSDGDEKVKATLWNTKKTAIEDMVNCLVAMDLMKEQYNGNDSYTIYNIRKEESSEYNITDFIITAPEIGEEVIKSVLAVLRKAVPKVEGELTLVDIAEDIYETYKEALIKYPAAKSMHHNCYGGLLWHHKRMVFEAYYTGNVYRKLDKELLLVGAALHDIGKIFELESNNFGEGDYTKNGVLFGHSYMGMQLIVKTASKLGYENEKLSLLLHLIASHHGEKEWGAMVVPAIPEAMVLHELDMIDSRMWMFEESIKNTEQGELSEWNRNLGTPVYHA